MAKLTILSCTNRPISRSLAISKAYAQFAFQHWESVEVVSLEQLNGMTISDAMYTPEGQDPILAKFQDEVFNPAQHFVFVLPEYNGTFSGIFKFMIDAISIRDKDGNFKGKTVAMIGVAAGRSGNLRGLDQLTNALNYLGMKVYENKIPISQIHAILNDETGEIDQNTTDLLTNHSKDYHSYVNSL